MANYFAGQFRSNGVSATAPTLYYGALENLPRGVVGFFDDTITFGAVLTTADTAYLARLPAGHIPLRVELDIDGDADTGANTLAVKIGTTADDDLVVGAAVIGNGDRHYSFPTAAAGGSAYGTTTSAKALRTTAAPSSDYNLTLIPTANATTSSTGTVYIRVYYACVQSVYSGNSGPAVVTS